jgi:hypothetical protein
MKKKMLLRAVAVGLVLAGWLEGCKPNPESQPDPIITRVSPERGSAGTLVRVSGKGFAQTATANRVLLNSLPVAVQQVEGDSILQFIVPDSATTGAIQVQVNKGGLVNGPLFVVPRNPNPPELTSLNPTSVEPGDVLIITGRNFRTGANLQQNIVRISGVKAELLAGTATELRIVIPGLPRGDLPVTVTVEGTVSNNLPVRFTGFDGKLAWTSTGTGFTFEPNLYRIEANADGSSPANARSIVRLSQTLRAGFNPFVAGTGGGIQADPVYAPVSRLMYFYNRRDGEHDPVRGITPEFMDVWQSSFSLSDAKVIYTTEVTNDGTAEYSSASSIAVSADGRGFYLSRGRFNREEDALFEGKENGSSPLRLLRSDPSRERGFSTIAPILTATQGIYSPVFNGQQYISQFRRFPLSPAQPSVDVPLTNLPDNSNSQGNIIAPVFNPADKKIYFFVQADPPSDNASRYLVCRVPETGGSVERLATFDIGNPVNDYPTPRYLQVLNTAVGIKLFWVSLTPANNDAIWLLNMKGQPPYRPVLLYNKPEEIPDDPATRQSTFTLQQNSLINSFFAINP